MIFALGVLCVAALGAAVATYAAEDEARLPERLALGACAGQAALGLLGYVLAATLGFTPGKVWAALTLVALPLLALARKAVRARLLADLKRLPAEVWAPGERLPTLVLAGVVLLLLRVFSRAVFETPAGLFTGSDHNLGDLPFHLGIVTTFTRAQAFPPWHPELAGARLTYPFLVDFVPAQLVTLGVGLVPALLAQNLVLAAAFAVLAFHWARRLTGASGPAALSLLLLVFSGGWGFYHLAEELRFGLPLLGHDYTIGFDGEFRWANLVVALLLPQRALFLGLPLFLAVTGWWWSALGREEAAPRATALMVGAGILAGLMPLVHAHAFLMLLCMAAVLALLFPAVRHWALFGAIAAGLGLPQVLWLATGSALQGQRFVGLELGWDHGRQPIAWFWLKNAGLVLPLLGLALAWRGALPRRLLRFYAPFLLCFLVPNLVRLSPWIWDNVKFLVFWYALSTPLLALLLFRLWALCTERRLAARLLARGVLALLALSLVLSGALDLARLARGRVAHRLFDPEGLAFAEAVAAQTPRDALIVQKPTYDHPVFLSGRRAFLGYPGHIWSQGLDGDGREAQIDAFYDGVPGSERLLRERGVDYVVLGPHERDPNLPFVLASTTPVLRVGPYELRRLRR